MYSWLTSISSAIICVRYSLLMNGFEMPIVKVSAAGSSVAAGACVASGAAVGSGAGASVGWGPHAPSNNVTRSTALKIVNSFLDMCSPLEFFREI
jgi:hypothetical protein